MKENKKSLVELLGEMHPDYDEKEWEILRAEHPEMFIDETEDDRNSKTLI